MKFKLAFAILVALTALLLIGPPAARQQADAGYGYGYGHGYGHNYYTPFYYYPTLPTYSYYQPTYNYGYGNNGAYYDGGYHWHDAGWQFGKYWPAGYYAWSNGTWVAQQNYQQPPANWRSQIIEIAKQREENKEFQDALKALGLSGFSHPNYGYSNANPYLGTYGAQGSTIYGYSSVRELYGSADINTLFQQAQRLAQNAQTLSGQATSEFQQAVTREGDNRSRVAEILAKAEAASQALRAAEGTGSRTTSTTVKIEPGKQPQVQQEGGQAKVQISPAFAQLATAKCLKCHGGDKTEGKFDVREYPQLSTADKEKVWERLMLSPNSERLMPKGGPPLTPEEKKIFFTN